MDVLTHLQLIHAQNACLDYFCLSIVAYYSKTYLKKNRIVSLTALKLHSCEITIKQERAK